MDGRKRSHQPIHSLIPIPRALFSYWELIFLFVIRSFSSHTYEESVLVS